MRGAPHRPPLAAALALSALAALVRADDATPTFVFCAPGSPGTAEEAQPTLDAFAAAVARQAGLPVAATYTPSEDAGLARLRAQDSAVAFVSLPFFLKHEQELSLRPELQPVLQGSNATERWSFVARKGRIGSGGDLDGFTILSSAGFAPDFVRGLARGGLGPLPPTVKIVQSVAVLSALRRAAAGEPVAVLLDGAQSAALATLPFAADLDVVARSPALPAGVVATVGRRLAPGRWTKIAAALRALPADPGGAAALAGVRVQRFDPLDADALAAARKAYREGSR